MGKAVKGIFGGKPKEKKAPAPVVQPSGPTQDAATVAALQAQQASALADQAKRKKLATALQDSVGGPTDTLG